MQLLQTLKLGIMNFLGDWNDYPNNLITFIFGSWITTDLSLPVTGKKIMPLCVHTDAGSEPVPSTRLFQLSW